MVYPNPFAEPTDEFSHVYGGIRYVQDYDEIVHGLYRWLVNIPELMALLGHLPGPDPTTPLLFENEFQGFAIEGKQTNAVIIRYGGGWSTPNTYNTLKFPRILLDFYCDPVRDEKGNTYDKGELLSRINYIYEKFDRVMHRPAALSPSTDKVTWWGTVRTIESVRLGEFSYNPVPEGDGLLVGQVAYGVQVG